MLRLPEDICLQAGSLTARAMSSISQGIRNPGKAFRYMYDRTDRKLGQLAFGKPVGFRNVVSGNIALKWAQRSSEIQTDENGEIDEFVELGQPFNDSIIETIQEKYESLIEDDRYGKVLSEYEGEEYLRSLGSWDDDFDLFEEIPELIDLVDGDIARLLQRYYGSHFQTIRVQAYRTYHIPDRVIEETELYSNYWHCDDHPVDHVKLFVYLSDVTEADGPFHILDESETEQLLEAGFNRGADGVSNGVVERGADVIKFTGEAGTTALANTQRLLHRAGNPEEGRHRDMLMMQFAPAKKPLPDDWPEQASRDITNGYSRLLAY